MTPVAFRFVSPTGEPVANAEVEIQLSKAGYDEDASGIVMPRPITVTTDENGEVTVELWPSQILYHVVVDDPASEAALHYKFLVPSLDVPGTTVRLQDIVVDGEMSNTTWDEAAILAIHDAKANAMAAQVAAEAALPNYASAPQDNPKPGYQWIDRATGKEYTWLVDLDGHGQWVETGAVAVTGYATQQAATLAIEAADAAKDSEEAAAESASAAADSATAAEAARDQAEVFASSDYAQEAADSAQAAANSEDAAAASAQDASDFADAAAASALEAQEAAENAAATSLDTVLEGFDDSDDSDVTDEDTILSGIGKLAAKMKTIEPTEPPEPPDLSDYVTVDQFNKASLGLGNVDNTSDQNKPISTATAAALAGKANVSHVHTKADVGLGNVDNTADLDKPISHATQEALDGLDTRLLAVEEQVGGSPATQPIVVFTQPRFAAADATLKVGVPVTRIAGVYSAGTVTRRWRTRGSVEVANGNMGTYTPVADDAGQMMTYYEEVTNAVTGEVKIVASAPMGPIEGPDVTEPGEVQSFDFTSGTSHDVTVARSGTTSTRRSGARTVQVMAANTKRYEHNASGNQIGLLCEKSKENYFRNAKNVAAITAPTANATESANYGTAPDGTQTATRVTAEAGGFSRGINAGHWDLPGIMKQMFWAKVNSGQEFVISDSDSGEYVDDKGPGTGQWELIEDQGTAAPASDYLMWRFFNNGGVLDAQVWGVALQPGSGYQTIVLSDGTNFTRPKEVWTVQLAAGSVTRDIQIEDHQGQVQNFLSQSIPSNGKWTLDANDVTISPVIAKMRVYTEGTLTTAPPTSGPPPPPPPSGDWEGPTISMQGLIDFMEKPDDAPKASFTLPAQQAAIQTPLNLEGVKYICFHSRNDGGAVPSNFYNEWDSVPLWLWMYLSNEWTVTGKRIQYRNLRFALLLDGPDGEWVKSALHPRLGSYQNSQYWLGRNGQGAPIQLLQSIQRDEPSNRGGGSSIILTDNQGIEMWANPAFYAMSNRSLMARAFAGAGIVEVRVINDDGTPYLGSGAKPLCALGGDLYSPNVQNPRMDGSGIPRAMDGFKSRWAKIDCTNTATQGWAPVAFVTCDFCYKKDGPRPPWGNYTGSWPVTSSTYNITKAQLMLNPPPFVVS